MSGRIRTSLDRAPDEPADAREIFELARKLWIDKGKPFFPEPEMVQNDFVRMGMFAEATRIFGPSKVRK